MARTASTMLGVRDSARVLFNFVESEVRATERRSSLSGSRGILKSSRNWIIILAV